jgi:para-aminobenzoate synthetase component I
VDSMNPVRPLLQEIQTAHTPESLAESLNGETGLVLLRTFSFDLPSARYSFVTAKPFLTFRSYGSRCEITHHSPLTHHSHFGNPWHLLDSLMSRCELLDEVDLPFPLGGCFGYWGYDLKNFVEPKLSRRAANDLELPDCQVGFYDSLVVFDHQLGTTWIVSTGLAPDGSRSEKRAGERVEFWRTKLLQPLEGLKIAGLHQGIVPTFPTPPEPGSSRREEAHALFTEKVRASSRRLLRSGGPLRELSSGTSRDDFVVAVMRAQNYIRAGDIYQVNLSHRLSVATELTGWELFQQLGSASPAPFSAYIDCDNGSEHGRFQIASSSPEQFLRMSGSQIVTRPIKGTRPRGTDPTRDAQLAYELQTSAKELAELVMITDLLRNDLGKVCEFGSVQTPDLARLEKFAQVQHLVSTVEGRLRSDVTHFAALASCFPGGSITGAPKIRAMEIIDELEPLSRGPYCGCHGFLGFNRESQLSITIRTAICKDGLAHFNVGAGIVADSNPEAEYEETLAKAAGFFAAVKQPRMDTDKHGLKLPD